MAGLGGLLVPGLLLLLSGAALARRVDVYDALVRGGGEGLRLTASILPALVILLTGVRMLRASGAIDLLTAALEPLCSRLGLPAQVVPLALLRPFSGSAALAVGAELMAVHGPNSLVGRTAAVMLGSTETTFYTISVYFAAAGVRRSRYAIPAALTADLTGFLAAALTVRLL